MCVCLWFYFLYDAICNAKSNELFTIIGLNNNPIFIGVGDIFCCCVFLCVRACVIMLVNLSVCACDSVNYQIIEMFHKA